MLWATGQPFALPGHQSPFLDVSGRCLITLLSELLPLWEHSESEAVFPVRYELQLPITSIWKVQPLSCVLIAMLHNFSRSLSRSLQLALPLTPLYPPTQCTISYTLQIHLHSVLHIFGGKSKWK